MGGKKKKGLSNRLAKMSDEERARYLQHRAAIEEEARRRKEQLIAIYMKNKIKREEAFTRLNIAKINEQWHQILRKIKIKELRAEIEDLSEWIMKVLDIKNSIIKRLMQELEEAEEQYLFNLNSHLSHLDNFIDMHYRRQQNVEYNYKIHKNTLMFNATLELDECIDKADKEEKYLKTVLFTLETNFADIQKQLKHFRDFRLEDYSNSLKSAQETMVKTYTDTMDKQWHAINSILSEYLAKTTVRRHHYIELKHLDERNTTERVNNEARITKYSEKINSLKSDLELSRYTYENQIKELEDLRNELKQNLYNQKQSLMKNIRKDDQLLLNLSVSSNDSIKYLEDKLEKFKQIENLVKCCRRLETEDESVLCWAKIHKKLEQFQDTYVEEFAEETEKKSVILPEETDLLNKLEGLFWCSNRAEIETDSMREEIKVLRAENNSLKGIIKGILKDAALEPATEEEIKKTCSKMKMKSSSLMRISPPSSSASSRQTLNYVLLNF